ncbi:MAG TPA: hypothetical protein VFF42_10130, partial [Candidatus Eremiobacteraceae bacterium]|nr:hypothetical protein [Candidatus Eremiobacteraceae bacterium]
MRAPRTSPPPNDLLRRIPSVDQLLLHPKLAALASRIQREHLLEIIRSVLSDLRVRAVAGQELAAEPENLVDSIVANVEQLFSPSLRPVINATGVILHT